MRPLLKWAGGKRALVNKIIRLFPREYKEKRYHEPFFGSGAVFFFMEPNGGSINDVNSHLMSFYSVVRDMPEEIIREASKYNYEETEYYRLRDLYNYGRLKEVERAALFLYLNKTAYNGLYRVNSRGEFNVPFGRYKNPTIVRERDIIQASRLLQKVEIRSEDFGYIKDSARKGDLCYLDPPYHPISKTSNFTNYIAGGFSFDDQKRLRDLCIELNTRGVKFVLSNSDTKAIRNLYQEIDGLSITSLNTKRTISSKVVSRTMGIDLLITNDK